MLIDPFALLEPLFTAILDELNIESVCVPLNVLFVASEVLRFNDPLPPLPLVYVPSKVPPDASTHVELATEKEALSFSPIILSPLSVIVPELLLISA